MFEEIAHGRMLGLRTISFWNMQSQGFERIIIQKMEIFKKNFGRVGGFDLFEEIAHGRM